MSKQLINLGTTVNDGTGDALRVGAQKINENFTELYNFLGSSGGQLSLVNSIITEEGLRVNSSSGNIAISAKIATTTELGSVIVGAGLSITSSGVLSATGLQNQFTGSYNDLTDKPELFSGVYNDLTGKPSIPETIFDLGINSAAPGSILVVQGTGTAQFSTLFDQQLSTTDDVEFNSVIANTTMTLNTEVTETQGIISALTSQRDTLENSTLPSMQSQLSGLQSQQLYWQSQVNSLPPGSEQWIFANNQLNIINGQIEVLNSQILAVQSQIVSIDNQIGYYQSILPVTTANIYFDHPTQSLVLSSNITTSTVFLEDSSIAVTETGLLSSTPGSFSVLTGNKSWVMGADGIFVVPVGATIIDGNGQSILTTPPNQTLNTTSDVDFNSVTAGTITTDTVLSTGTGIPTFTSATSINFNAAEAVVIGTSPLRLASLTTTQRDALVALNGDMIYNTTLNKIQGFQNGTWINLDGTV